MNAALAAARPRPAATSRSYILFMIIADETDEDGDGQVAALRDGADQDALAWLTNQAAADARADRQHQSPPSRARSRR